MSFHPLPYAKRNKITSGKPTLDPSAPREASFHHFQHQHREADRRQTSSSAADKASGSSPSRSSQRTRNKGSSNWSRSSQPIYGNYVNYYTKRDGGQLTLLDPRLALCDPSWFTDKRVLDVGCNAGKVTIEVGHHFQARSVTGVDIDPQLIKQSERARKFRHCTTVRLVATSTGLYPRVQSFTVDLAWSRQSPLAGLIEKASEHHLIPNHSNRPAPPAKPDPRHFPLSMPRMLGFLPVPRDHLIEWVEQSVEHLSGAARGRGQEQEDDGRRGKRRKMAPPKEVRTFPTNVRFRTADWPVDGADEDRKGYDTILAFSVTKWIHLHTLNSGLLAFFTRCYNALLPGGRLILEPQPFSSYAPSARYVDELKANLQLMKEEGEFRGWRAEDGDFEKVLLGQIGFERVDKLGDTSKDGFRRPIEVYVKSGGSWL
ncbi:BZ3500_MvSof-1268-A1-R1_Chr4-2g07095 [Microbotryum saponariae]|uniref:RNA methyltransferase n=1 Tax=Microbotryum saponariae TaxID=289078 RepID=A0A2X0LM22_9BASI|nr:BZ3500_MvSof-1268-A1-R1_Chr4-2g07095 [Microbotryum saponariae]SDA06760.1 BZ3501_MvSof-1269-A2-R1_Chr4-2g06806 [Microbotryum saponariae]